MDHLKIHIFSLNQEEEKDRKDRGIPTYYWLYLKALEKGWKFKDIKKFVLERIKKKLKKSIFSNIEIWALAAAITREIRRFVKNYLDGKVADIQESEKKFKSEVFALFQKFSKKSAKQEKKADQTFIFTFWDEDLELEIKLEPTIVHSYLSKATKDNYCMYFLKCYDLSREQEGRLNCKLCLQQNVVN